MLFTSTNLMLNGISPILREMHAILFEGKVPASAIKALMTRGLKRE